MVLLGFDCFARCLQLSSSVTCQQRSTSNAMDLNTNNQVRLKTGENMHLWNNTFVSKLSLLQLAEFLTQSIFLTSYKINNTFILKFFFLMH